MSNQSDLIAALAAVNPDDQAALIHGMIQKMTLADVSAAMFQMLETAATKRGGRVFMQCLATRAFRITHTDRYLDNGEES